MNITYQIRISSNQIAKLDELLGFESESIDCFWVKSLVQRESDSPVEYSKYFRDLVEGKMNKLKSLAEGLSPISIWILYEYDNQCNLEFSIQELDDFRAIGASVCISCWEA